MINRAFLIVTLTGLLFACASTDGTKQRAAVEDRGSRIIDQSEARAFGTGIDAATSMRALNDPQNPLSVRLIYFEYNSSEVQPQFRRTIEAHAQFLVANPQVTLVLEGHADERGSREYNLALGERRAIVIKRQMTLLGASAAQLRTTSYGEERPADEGHNEFSWSQNRRTELIY